MYGPWLLSGVRKLDVICVLGRARRYCAPGHFSKSQQKNPISIFVGNEFQTRALFTSKSRVICLERYPLHTEIYLWDMNSDLRLTNSFKFKIKVLSVQLYELVRFQGLIMMMRWFGSGYGLLESPCKCGIEPPGSISHGVT